MKYTSQKYFLFFFVVGFIPLTTQAVDEIVFTQLSLEAWVKPGLNALELSNKLASKGKYIQDETPHYIAFSNTEQVELLGKKWEQSFVLTPRENGLSRINYHRNSNSGSALDGWTGDEDGAEIDERHIDQCEEEFQHYLSDLTSMFKAKPLEENFYNDSLEYSWKLPDGTRIVAEHSCTSGPLLQNISIELHNPKRKLE